MRKNERVFNNVQWLLASCIVTPFVNWCDKVELREATKREERQIEARRREDLSKKIASQKR